MGLFVNGGENIQAAAQVGDEVSRAQDLARRYRCEFIDLKNFHIHHELLKAVPVDLMVRYNFIPREHNHGELTIAIADPSRLMMIDEIGLLLNKRIVTKGGTLRPISARLTETER